MVQKQIQGDNTSLNNIGHIYDYYYDDSRLPINGIQKLQIKKITMLNIT